MSENIAALLQKAETQFTQGNHKKALKLANALLKKDRKNHAALVVKANALHTMEDLDHSIPAYEEILELYPDNHTVIIILIQHYSSKKDWEKLSAITRHALQYPQQANTFTQAYIELHGLCDWESLNKIHHTLLETINHNRDNPIIFQQLLFTLLALPGFSEEQIFETHKIVAQRFMTLADGKQYTSYKKAGKKLKIGYVSGDLFLHPVGVFVQFCIEHHNRDYFDIYCYADLVCDDDLTDKFRRISDHFIEITKQAADQVAKRIHDDGIDILIDLGGYTGRVLLEIFAYKPAPVQISYCGYPYSTALPTIDYRISDPYAEGNIKNYTEELIYMPESFLCMGGGYSHSICSPAPCEKNDHITFGSFNDLRKINIPVIQLWSKVLALVPNSKLLMRNRKVEGIFSRRIADQFAQCGIGEDRLIFVHGNLPAEEHCSYYGEVDIVLDVFPFCGTTTSLETLWYNVPVITLVGETHRQRPTYSMLKNIGFTEGIAFTKGEYIDKAVAMASQSPESLSLVRRCIYTLTRASILFQPEAFTHQLDQLLLHAWNKKTGDNRALNADDPGYSYKFPLQASTNETTDNINKIDNAYGDSIDLIMRDGVTMALPNNIELLTPYCMAEKLDWFDIEIDFIRQYTRSGMKALDIGACYGAYSLPIANKLGETGRLWSFEPGNQAYNFLSTSISNNNFTNTTLIGVALSDHKGAGTLHTCSNVELNSLGLYYDTNNVDQDVSLKTLDSYLEKYQWSNIDLVKMDTTGGELDIFKGGEAFFTKLSPLIIFAYKNDTVYNTDLIEAFESIGYNIYMLIPGLQILAPFNRNDSPDAYLLNLFCCKPDTAEKLQQRGLLTTNLSSNDSEASHKNWESYLETFPYSSTLIDTWKSLTTEHVLPGWQIYEHAMNLYAAAHAEQSSPTLRVQSLYDAFIQMVSLVDIHMTIPRLVSLIRIASELGKRETAVHLLNGVIDSLQETGSFHPDEPFLAVSKAAEQSPISSTLASWCLAYCIAEKELLSNFSSYSLTDESSLELLKPFEESNYSHEEIRRRFTLIRKRFHSDPTGNSSDE